MSSLDTANHTELRLIRLENDFGREKYLKLFQLAPSPGMHTLLHLLLLPLLLWLLLLLLVIQVWLLLLLFLFLLLLLLLLEIYRTLGLISKFHF